MIPFTVRNDLTEEEKRALESYQDIDSPQHGWNLLLPKGLKNKDCYVINNTLRSVSVRDSMDRHDRDIVDYLILQIDSAIAKSDITEKVDVFRGLSDPSWLEYMDVDSGFMDDAYGSFTLDINVAAKFAGTNASNEKVFLVRELEKGNRAVYMGDKEEEMLIPRRRKYVVDAIVHFDKDEFISGHKAIVYYITEV